MSDLMPRCYVGDLELTDYPFSLAYNELDLGAGENMMAFFEALLQDGEIGTSDRTGNRTLVVPIYVEGADLLELARNEETLILACEQARNTFTLDPGDGLGPATVFDTFRIQAVHSRNDDFESALLRRWNLTIPAMPFARSADPVTVSFTPGTPTVTTLDDGSALTNWSVAPGSSPTTLSVQTYLGEQSVRSVQTAVDNNRVVTLRVSNVSPVTTYIAVDVAKESGGGSLTNVVVSSSAGASQALASVLQASGYRRYYFSAPAAPFDILLYNGFTDAEVRAGGVGATIHVGGVYGATVFPSTGVLVAEVPGSVRTQGVITVEGGAALGDTMVYCDPTMMTHGWQPDNDNTWANAPEGTYMVYVRDAASAAGGTWTESANGQSVSTYLAVSAVPNSSWFPVGRVALGGLRSGRVGSTFSPLTDADTRIFRVAPDTSLTYVRGLAQSRLLIDLPSLDYPRGGVWAGAAGAEASVLNAADSWEFPTLTPPLTALFIRAEGDADPESSATFYPRSHTFNAYEAS